MGELNDSCDDIVGISSQKKVRNYFDHVAATGLYSSRDGLYSGFFEERDNHIADKISSENFCNLRVLDAGCGDGSGFIRLRERLKYLDITYHGFDISPKMVENSVNQGLNVVEGDLVDLSRYPDGGFDIVLSLFGSICYLPEERKRKTALREFMRVLAGGGLLALDVFYRPNEQDCTYSLEEKGLVEGWIHLFGKGQVGNMLAAEGFTIIHTSKHKTEFPQRNYGPKDNLHELYICKKISRRG